MSDKTSKLYYYDIRHKDHRETVMVTIRAESQDSARREITRSFGPEWKIVQEIKTLPKV